MGRTCRYLTIGEIKRINNYMVSRFGGEYHLMNPGSLEYMTEEIQGFLYGKEIHPGIFEKAGFLLERLICGHFFFDGNKRTGVEACNLFLRMNGYILNAEKHEIIKLVKHISENNISREEITSWLRSKSFAEYNEIDC